MTVKDKIIELANKNSEPSVTISFNTHRTHPENQQDSIVMKNLLSEAQDRVIEQYGKRPAAELLDKISTVSNEIQMKYNLESMHIFLSNDTQEVVKTTWPVHEDVVQIGDSFALRPLIKAYSRSDEYLLLSLSQSGVTLYEALNDSILTEIKNEDFPYEESPYYISNSEKASDAKKQDNMVREYLNQVDKALVKIHRKTDLKCVVVCTEDNYSKLLEIADIPEMYLGYARIDYNKTEPHDIVEQSWEIIQKVQSERRTKALEEMQAAVSAGKVLSDLSEIFQAAIDGKADLLLVNQDFSQPVLLTSERTFDYIDDPQTPNAIEDITNLIAWEVLKNKGRVVFTSREPLADFGDIALKLRY